MSRHNAVIMQQTIHRRKIVRQEQETTTDQND